MAINFQNVILAVILVVPGFISVQIAITVGVIESQVRERTIIISSIVTSALIFITYVSIWQEVFDNSLTSFESINSVFFDPSFEPLNAFGLLFMSVVFGLVYSYALVNEITEKTRQFVWKGKNWSRHPWQPWEGTFRSAHKVKITTTDGEIVVGDLGEYSRVNKPKQLRINDPYWLEDGELVEDSANSVLLLEEDVFRASVLMTEKEREEWEEREGDTPSDG